MKTALALEPTILPSSLPQSSSNSKDPKKEDIKDMKDMQDIKEGTLALPKGHPRKAARPEDVIKLIKKEFSLVMQKELSITTPDSKQPIVGTESVRGCYAISIYHPTMTYFIHWDDCTRKSEILRIIAEITQKGLDIKDVVFNIAGGWSDHSESVKTGTYLKKTIREQGFILTEIGYQEKVTGDQTVSIKTGFKFVGIDSRTGQIILSDNINMKFDVKDYGENIELRYAAQQQALKIHLQEDEFPESGSSLIFKETFSAQCSKELISMCLAAQKNNKSGLIELIDKGIVNLNYNLTPETKGNTPLHYACRYKSWDIAYLLIAHGASLSTQNSAGKTPAASISPENRAEYLKMQSLEQVYKSNLAKGGNMLVFSMGFRHYEMLDAESKMSFSAIKSAFNL